MKTQKPIRCVFTNEQGRPLMHPDGKVDEKLWTAQGHHWLKSDGPFPYYSCDTRYIVYRGGGSVLDATPA